MKKFLSKKVNFSKSIGSILLETLIESFVVVLIIFLFLTWAKDAFLNLLNSIYTTRDAITVSLISLPLVIVLMETLTIGKYAMKIDNKK